MAPADRSFAHCNAPAPCHRPGAGRPLMGGIDMQETTVPTVPENASRPCQCTWLTMNDHYELAEQTHRDILSFEDRGLAGVIEVLEHVDMSTDCEMPSGIPPLYYYDFEGFVADHNWRDPVLVAQLAARINFDRRMLESAYRRREVLK